MNHAEQRAAIERLIDRIDMRINNGGHLECIIPAGSDLYSDEGVDRDAFIREVLASLREQGFDFKKVYALGRKGRTRLIYPRPKTTLHQAFAMVRRQRRSQRKQGGC